MHKILPFPQSSNSSAALSDETERIQDGCLGKTDEALLSYPLALAATKMSGGLSCHALMISRWHGSSFSETHIVLFGYKKDSFQPITNYDDISLPIHPSYFLMVISKIIIHRRKTGYN